MKCHLPNYAMPWKARNAATEQNLVQSNIAGLEQQEWEQLLVHSLEVVLRCHRKVVCAAE